MKTRLNGKFGETIACFAALVPLFAFLIYIEAVSWVGVGAIAAAAAAIGGGFVVLSGLFAHGTNVVRLRGPPVVAFWGGCLTAGAGVACLLWLEAHDMLVIGGVGLGLVCILLAFARSRSAGDA